MIEDFSGFLAVFWLIFSFSFLVALTGAIAPGPLLTYTIFKSTKSPQRGYLMGVWIVLGHALIEIVIIVLLLLGFSFVLKNLVVVRTIGVLGGLILCYLGFSIIYDVKRGNIQSDFFSTSDREKTDGIGERAFAHRTIEAGQAHGRISEPLSRRIMSHPVSGGMIVSMSNPYWWVWWATIGFAFMVQFDVTLTQWPKLLAFFLGHEAGDMTWYVVVSTLSFFGIRRLSRKVYHGILVFCGVFMMGFGPYLAIMAFIK